MRLAILVMCALLAAGVAVTVFLAVWSTPGASATPSAFRQNLRAELAWAAIPSLMVLAAAIPAVVAIVSTRTGD